MDSSPVAPVLRATGISKRFGAVVALEDVGIEVAAGEIAGLVGDNGAGKSTLIKILSAVLRADTGTIEFDGQPMSFASPAEARAAGIETVYQDLALAGNMTVWSNIFLGRERTSGLGLLDKRGMAREARQMLERFRMNVPPINAPVAALSGGQRQAIAIARAAAWGSKLIIMDEPTAALGIGETRAVEEVILGLKERGFALLIISHNLDQVFRLADSIWVLRRGRLIGTRRRAQTTPDEIVSLITGAAAATGRENVA
ncbi:MAG: simple sugar transport system ATP-binding protein [Thermomicrobiales bacterium]|nr:simple sugar transport system ATP-binding protein [Thermomicrobiales bacterium]